MLKTGLNPLPASGVDEDTAELTLEARSEVLSAAGRSFLTVTAEATVTGTMGGG
jgi:hypothetical protein